MPTWPEWWDWELELSSHILKRMEDREFSELDVRQMLSTASGLRRDIVQDRWIVETRRRRRPWEIIVEPDADAHLLIVITAYPIEP